MLKKIIILLCLCLPTLYSCAQNSQRDYEGNWVGTLPNKFSFNFNITLEHLGSNDYHLVIANDKVLIDKKLKSSSTSPIQMNIDDTLVINLFDKHNGQELTGFINSGNYYYHIALQYNKEKDIYMGKWNPFMLDNGLLSDDFVLYVENMPDKTIAAYPIFSDQRFRGTYSKDFSMAGNTLSFRDANTGFNFRAQFYKETIRLEMYLLDAMVTKINLTYSEEGIPLGNTNIPKDQNTNTPIVLNDGWNVANIKEFNINDTKLTELIDHVNSQKLVNVHSVLIAKNQKLVFETYFDGYNAKIPHDLRSASKSISSAIIGIAIEEKIIKGVDQKLYDLLPQTYHYTKDDLKSKIRIKDLLTMSSGMDVNNKASENYYQDPRYSNNWLKTVLEAPMVNEPGTYADYGSANPFLLGVALNENLEKPVEIYMDEKLFAPLGITNYINQTDDTGLTPYFGGGMLLTPRDLLKFGQLYLNKGKWKNQQIISKKWVKESFGKHLRLQDYKDKNEYGYLWWHDTYVVNGRTINSIEARGAGGQFIFIVPELESVIVITAGNYRNRKGNQSREIFKDYILPAIIN